MRLLLDTQCWLWWFAQPNRLNEEIIDQIADETNDLLLSVASIWEMGIKSALGKLPLPESIEDYLASRMMQLEVRTLDISASHALQAASLPLCHRDPFDRMLIAQAQLENLTLVSADAMFKQYSGFSLLWAGSS